MKKYIIFTIISILIIEKTFSFYVDEITDSFEIINNSNNTVINIPENNNIPVNRNSTWGWWSSPWLVMDNCPNWDYSPSYYDWTCWNKPIENKNTKIEIIIEENEEEDIIFNSAAEIKNNQTNSKENNENSINASWFMIPWINTFWNIWESEITTEELKNIVTVEKVASEAWKLPNTWANQIMILIMTLLISSIIFLKRRRY